MDEKKEHNALDLDAKSHAASSSGVHDTNHLIAQSL